MTTPKNEKTAVTMEDLAAALQKLELSQQEVLGGQEKAAVTLSNMEQRLSKVEGDVKTADNAEKLHKALEANKPGIAQKFRHASTGKKAAIVTVAAAATAGLAYGGYKGYETYRDRKAAGQPLLSVNEVPSVSPAKNDAIRQGLGSK